MEANDHLKFHGKKMSEAMNDMDAYIQLTDEVFQHILHSTDSRMEKVHNIVSVLNRFSWCANHLSFHYIGSQDSKAAANKGSVQVHYW